MEKVIFDGKNAIVGRLGCAVAKELLKGNSVVIINSEEAIISGERRRILEKMEGLRKKGGTSRKGPKVPRLADRFLKRMIRGMLPWDRQKGKKAYKRLRCYIGNGKGELGIKPEELKAVIKLEFKKPVKFIKIGQLVRELK